MTLRNIHALVFAGTDAHFAAARMAGQDPRLARSRIEVERGGVIEAADYLVTHPSPDVLFVYDPVDEFMWDRMEKLADNVESHCRVVVIGPRDNIAIYRELVARGVADYLGGEVEPGEIVDCIARLFAAEDNLPRGKLVAVVSAVGGAGGSTVAVALAASLARRLGDATLLDMDLPTGTAALLMGVDPRDPVASALSNPGLDAAMLERFMAREGNVRVLSTAGGLRDARFIDGDTIERLVTIARSMSKVVVVDMPKGWGDEYERVVTLADEVVVVARPDLASLRNTRMMVEDIASRRIEGRRPKLVLNAVGQSKKNEFGQADFQESGGTVPSVLVPFDPDPMLVAISEGKPIHQAGGKAMTAILHFADTVLAAEGAKAAPRKAKPDPIVELLGKLGFSAKKKEKA